MTAKLTTGEQLRADYFKGEEAGDNAEEVNAILDYLEANGVEPFDPAETEQGLSGRAAAALDRFLDTDWDPGA